jgi:CsoR family transcriptional regulator, copper-sensing transcriptional repressor
VRFVLFVPPWLRRLRVQASSKHRPSIQRIQVMLDQSQQQQLVTRLNRIEGQVRGIRRMIEEPRLCVEILQQLAAAEAALNRISLAVVKFHAETCVPDAITRGDDERTRTLAELVDIFDRFAK